MPRGRRTAPRARSGLLAAGLLLVCSCIREHPADLPLPAVDSTGEVPIGSAPDRRAALFQLSPACDAERVGVNTKRMTLTARGLDVVFSGIRSAASGDPIDEASAMIVSAGGADGCPPMTWPEQQQMKRFAEAASLPVRDGLLLAFAGGWRGTTAVISHDEVNGWRVSDLASAPPLSEEPNPGWSTPNAVAVRLDGGRAVVVRGAATGDPSASAGTAPIQIEWIDVADSGVTVATRTALPSGTPAFSRIASARGQIALYPSLDDPAGLLAVGDAGQPLFMHQDDAEVVLLPVPARRSGIALQSATAPGDEGAANASLEVAPNRGATSVLLPLRPSRPESDPYPPGSILFIGGHSDCVEADCDRAVDLLHPSGTAWTPMSPLPRRRRNGAATLLPDGSILVAGGGQVDRQLLYLDPRQGFTWTHGEDLFRQRGWGVGAVVLADGRVVIAGGRDTAAAEPSVPADAELWAPPYLHRHPDGARPSIASAPPQISAAVPFALTVDPGSPGAVEIVLLAYGNPFVGTDLNQWLIELSIDGSQSDVGAGTLVVYGPPPGWAPTGPYLLFALDADRVPSVGWPIEVVASPAPLPGP